MAPRTRADHRPHLHVEVVRERSKLIGRHFDRPFPHREAALGPERSNTLRPDVKHNLHVL